MDTRRLRRRLPLLLTTIVVACSSGDDDGEVVARDAGTRDAGTRDAGPRDAGPRDGGEDPREMNLDRAFTFLAGRFDSTAQAAADMRYFEIQLHVCEVTAADVGPRVLYVEQAVMTSLDRPYRQRVYVVEPGAGVQDVVSRVYTIAGEANWVGACNEAMPRTLTANDITERAGCAVELEWQTDRFVGGTVGNGCASTLNGATYATSEVEMTATEVRSWDRGYDEQDQQVWGAEAGPYIFVRQD